MRVALLIPSGFLCAAATASWLLRNAPDAVSADRAQPLTVVNYWQQFGGEIWLALALGLTIASIGYVGVLRSANMPTLRVTCAICALACIAALLFPAILSSDVYAYAGYGDMALHGINPYAHARVAMRDPLLDAMVWQWGNPPPACVYGPAFVALAQLAVATLLPLGAAAPLWAFRALSCAALIACAPLAYAAFARFDPRTRLAAAAGIALNPVALWSAAEGHNDAIALAAVLGGFALAARGKAFGGAFAVALSALIKAPAALAALALVLCSRHDARRFKHAALGATLGLAGAIALQYPLARGMFARLGAGAHYAPQFSLQDVSVPLALGAIALLLACALLTPGRARFAYFAFAAWLAIPNPYPWYALWLLPVAFLAWESPPAWALLSASLLAALRYYPDATSALPRAQNVALALLQNGVPLTVLVAYTAYARLRRPESRTPAPGFAAPRLP